MLNSSLDFIFICRSFMGLTVLGPGESLYLELNLNQDYAVEIKGSARTRLPIIGIIIIIIIIKIYSHTNIYFVKLLKNPNFLVSFINGNLVNIL